MEIWTDGLTMHCLQSDQFNQDLLKLKMKKMHKNIEMEALTCEVTGLMTCHLRFWVGSDNILIVQ